MAYSVIVDEIPALRISFTSATTRRFAPGPARMVPFSAQRKPAGAAWRLWPKAGLLLTPKAVSVVTSRLSGGDDERWLDVDGVHLAVTLGGAGLVRSLGYGFGDLLEDASVEDGGDDVFIA